MYAALGVVLVENIIDKVVVDCIKMKLSGRVALGQGFAFIAKAEEVSSIQNLTELHGMETADVTILEMARFANEVR